MEQLLAFLAAIAILMIPIIVYAEIMARRNGSGILRAFKAAIAPKVEIRYQVIRANGQREDERLARTARATFFARMRLFHISFLLHAKKMLEDLSRYLKQLGG